MPRGTNQAKRRLLTRAARKRAALTCVLGAVTVLAAAPPGAAQQLTNSRLSITVDAQNGSYELATRAPGNQTILSARVAAQIDHQWLRSSDYPRHQVSESTFSDELGPGHAVTVTFSGLDGKPDLIYVGQIYDQRPYAAVQVQVHNTTIGN